MKRPRGYTKGDWLADCYQCGKTRLASTMRRHWQGHYVCPEHWEPRHPQEFVRATKDDQTVPWLQSPPEDQFAVYCTINSQSAIPGFAVPGCSMPGRTYIDYESIPVLSVPPACDIYERQGVPGWGGPGCAIPGFDPFAA